MAGRTLTEEQKAERAARKIEARHRDELGPLVAHETPVVDVEALLMQRRQGWAKSIERIEERDGEGSRYLAALGVYALESLARQHMPGEDVDALAAKVRRTYPEGMRESVWLDILAGRWREATSYRWDAEGGKRRLVKDGVLPREGFVPLGEEWRRTWFWTDCKACGLRHAPGQAACLPKHEAESPPLEARP